MWHAGTFKNSENIQPLQTTDNAIAIRRTTLRNSVSLAFARQATDRMWPRPNSLARLRPSPPATIRGSLAVLLPHITKRSESQAMDDDCDSEGECPYAEPAPTELALRLLRAHRENPAQDDFILLEGATIDEIDAAYRNLREIGLVEFTDRIIPIGDGKRRTTQRLTKDGL